jgi:hypothetical protein
LQLAGIVDYVASGFQILCCLNGIAGQLAMNVYKKIRQKGNEMTVQEKVVQLLLNSGMSPKETIALLEKAKSEMPQMKNRWQDNIEGYLPFSLAAIVLAVKGYQG